jgi:hypothetical protein
MLGLFEDMANREIPANVIKSICSNFLGKASPELRTLFTYAINRQLPGNIGEALVNKAFPGLIYHQPYGGVSSFDPEKAESRFHWPSGVALQEKADGLSLFIEKAGPHGVEGAHTRQGQDVYSQMLTYIQPILRVMHHDVLHCEVVLWHKGQLVDRAEANGVFNSQFQGTDAIKAGGYYVEFKGLDLIRYDRFFDGFEPLQQRDRYFKLCTLCEDYCDSIEGVEDRFPAFTVIDEVLVHSLADAQRVVGGWIAMGYEGGVLKDRGAPWKDTRMVSQMKLKNQFECSLLVTGVIPHKRNPDWIGSLVCESATPVPFGARAMIHTKVGSGLNEDKESPLCRITPASDWIGKVVDVRAECITKHNALQHPRVVAVRIDKTLPDTYEEVLAAYNDSINVR